MRHPEVPSVPPGSPPLHQARALAPPFSVPLFSLPSEQPTRGRQPSVHRADQRPWQLPPGFGTSQPPACSPPAPLLAHFLIHECNGGVMITCFVVIRITESAHKEPETPPQTLREWLLLLHCCRKSQGRESRTCFPPGAPAWRTRAAGTKAFREAGTCHSAQANPPSTLDLVLPPAQLPPARPNVRNGKSAQPPETTDMGGGSVSEAGWPPRVLFHLSWSKP